MGVRSDQSVLMELSGCRDDETEEEQAQKDRLIQVSVGLCRALQCNFLPAKFCEHLWYCHHPNVASPSSTDLQPAAG